MTGRQPHDLVFGQYGGARPGRAGLVRRLAGSGRGVQVEDAGMPIASPAPTWMSAPRRRGVRSEDPRHLNLHSLGHHPVMSQTTVYDTG